MMKISKNKFVSVTYDLHVGDDDELELMEQATAERPLQFIYGIGLMFDRDIFSKVMALSPKLIPKEAVEAVSKEDDPYELQMLYVGAGDHEGNTKRSKEQYDQLLNASPWLEEGRNAFYTLVTGGHNWPTWRTHLVNALQMFF